jgi:hypothetical protein
MKSFQQSSKKQQAALIAKCGLWPFGQIRPELLAPALCGRTGHGLLHARRLAFSASHESLRAPHRPPRAAHRFDSVLNTQRGASPADCSALDSLRSCWPRIAPCYGLLRSSALRTLPRLRIAPHSTLSFPRLSRIAPSSTPSALRRSRIAPCSTLGPPCRSTDCSVL